MKFESYHPTINVIYFLFVLTAAVVFNHPVYAAIAFFTAFVYSIKLNGKRSVILNLILVPCIFLYGCWYAFYHHFGITNLGKNFIDNNITLESLCYGMVRGMMAAAFIMAFSAMLTVMSTDKVIYLVGRIFPRGSLFISIFLRSFSRVRHRFLATDRSRKGIGMGKGHGNILHKIRNCVRIVSIVITWTLEDYIESSQSMKCRGYTLKGRTAFSIYRFDNRDRSVVIMLCTGIIVTVMAYALGQTNIMYDPEIIIYKPAFWAYFFYAVYAFVCFLPMMLELFNEAVYNRVSRNI
ncbi:MAG: energy-coupling factor transporter transmembrane protein EcfT [Clostridium sp.]|nr:energy-coupling factor transporter transmembrane protein EcfT [Clostridium sp.]MCM1399025.1 energy-coupling factor transporter transmembrane protein EcfT [Clostridium sp.]MCM1458884.1 energy-coupling factor transporter transmembrane protein EcfT [Bacteroides sp.]